MCVCAKIKLMETTIKKKIHYFWFGDNTKNNLIQNCITSWQKKLSNYEIIEWNEKNYDINKSVFTQKAFAEKKWAFLSDYARLDVLYQHGGIYLDTDMEVLKPLDIFLKQGLFLGMESPTHINGSIIGSQPGHWLLREILDEYNTLQTYETIPTIITRVLERYITTNNHVQTYQDITIYPNEYFYPFGFGENFSPACITENTYTIHWWDHSWGSIKARLLRKLGLLKTARWVKNKLT